MIRVRFVFFIILCSLFLASCSKSTNKKQDNKSMEVFQKEDNFIEVFGVVKSTRVKSINLTFDAQIDTIPVKEGQKVKKGEVLLTLSLADIEISINEKEYQLLNEQFELKKISLDNYGPNSLKYSIQKKKVDNLQFELNQLKDTLRNNSIINGKLLCDVGNGVISEISYAEGDFIQKDKTIMSIYDLDTIRIIADIPEEFIKDVKVMDAVMIIPVADRSKSYKGKIERIYDVATQKGGETIIYAEIAIEDMDDFLLPNYNVDVRIEKGK